MNSKERSIIDRGYARLSADQLREKIVNTRVTGRYRGGFRFVGSVHADGTMKGENNVGTRDVGTWRIDDDHTFSVRWDHGWDATRTRVYDVEGELAFFDTDTREWRMTLVSLVAL